MPASKTNYVVIYRNVSQVYACKSKEIALQSPPPEGSTVEDKTVLFITHPPDTNEIVLHAVPKEEVLDAEIKWPKPKEPKVTIVDEEY